MPVSHTLPWHGAKLHLMNLSTAWLLLLVLVGARSVSGQPTAVREVKLSTLSTSVVLTTEDLWHAETTNPFLIDRWWIKATAGNTICDYPEGKGEPPYPILDIDLWDRYSLLDLELLGHIHRLPNQYNRYRIGTTRKVLSLLPASQLNTLVNQERASDPTAVKRP